MKTRNNVILFDTSLADKVDFSLEELLSYYQLRCQWHLEQANQHVLYADKWEAKHKELKARWPCRN